MALNRDGEVMTNRLAPMGAKTLKAICRMESDNHEARRNGWHIMLSEDYVTITGPRKSKVSLDVPRKQFDELIKWYVKPQQLGDSE